MLGVESLVTVLVRGKIIERGSILLSGRPPPIQPKSNGSPGCLGAKFLLTNIVGPTSAVHPLTTAEGGEVQDGPIGHIIVVPMIYAGTEENHRFSLGFFGIFGKFPGHPNHIIFGNSGYPFLPSGSVGFRIVIVFCNFASLASVHTKIGGHKIKDRCDQDFLAVPSDLFHRDFANFYLGTMKIKKRKPKGNPTVIFIRKA